MPVASRQPLKDPRETSMAAIAMVYRCISPRRTGASSPSVTKVGHGLRSINDSRESTDSPILYPPRDEAVNDS